MSLVASAHAEDGGGRELFRRELGGGRAVVAAVGPVKPATAVRDLLPTDAVARAAGGCASFQVDLREDGGQRFPVWTTVLLIDRAARYDDLRVLDLLVVPGRVILATTNHGGAIELTDVSLATAGARTAGLPPDWSLVSAGALAGTARLAATLSYDAATGRVAVDVTDTLQDQVKRTRFEQPPGGSWEFSKAPSVKATP